MILRKGTGRCESYPTHLQIYFIKSTWWWIDDLSISTHCLHLPSDLRYPKSAAVHMPPDSQRDGVSGKPEVCTQRPSCKELHVSLTNSMVMMCRHHWGQGCNVIAACFTTRRACTCTSWLSYVTNWWQTHTE